MIADWKETGLVYELPGIQRSNRPEQLDDILTSPGTVTRGITGGNFAGGRYYIAPDGRGAAFDANGVFQYFGVFMR